MVDLGEAGIVCGIEDAPGISGGGGGAVAGVDQQRLARGGDEERGVAALDVYHVDIESGSTLRGHPRRRQPPVRAQNGQTEDRNKDERPGVHIVLLCR
jgi:hypothetical protein